MDVLPVVVAVISVVFSSDKSVPSTIQPIAPLLALQLKVAVDPSVILIDMGVLIKSEIQMNKNWYVHTATCTVFFFRITCNLPYRHVPGMLYYGAIINLIYLHGYQIELGYLIQ